MLFAHICMCKHKHAIVKITMIFHWFSHSDGSMSHLIDYDSFNSGRRTQYLTEQDVYCFVSLNKARALHVELMYCDGVFLDTRGCCEHM